MGRVGGNVVRQPVGRRFGEHSALRKHNTVGLLLAKTVEMMYKYITNPIRWAL